MANIPVTLKERIKSWLPFTYMVLLLLTLRFSLVEPYVVPTGSMEPTLKPGDRLYALKCAYDFRLPWPPYVDTNFPYLHFNDLILFRTGKVKRGDVILFLFPRDPSLTYVKRAVGLPGDKVRVNDGVVYVNGEAVNKVITQERSTMYDIESEETKTLYVETLGGVRHYVILDRRIDGSYDLQQQVRRFMDEVTIPEGHLFAMGDNRDNSYDSRGWGFVPFENLKGRGMFIWYSSKNYIPRTERVGTLIQ